MNRAGSGTDSISNNIYVHQDGDLNQSEILMRGVNNDVVSYQFGQENRVSIDQRYYGNTDIFSEQFGFANDLSIQVRGNTNVYTGLQQGSENQVDLSMFSNRGDVSLEQSGQLNSVSLLLSAARNTATFAQFGDSNTVEGIGGGAFEMGGQDDSLSVTQQGMGNLVQGIQLSDSSSITVTQIGSMNTAVVSQY